MKITPKEPTLEVAKLILDYGQACFECGAYDGNIPRKYQLLSDARALAHTLLIAKIGAMHDAAATVEAEPVAWRPMWPDNIRMLCSLTLGEASQQTIDYFQREYGIGIEYVYTHPAAPTVEAGPAAEITHVSGAGPNDVGIRWRGGLPVIGTNLYTHPAAPQPAALPEPDYKAGEKGMLGEDCYSAATVRAYGEACARAALKGEQ